MNNFSFKNFKLDVILLFTYLFKIIEGIAISHWKVYYSLKTQNVKFDILGGKNLVRLLKF